MFRRLSKSRKGEKKVVESKKDIESESGKHVGNGNRSNADIGKGQDVSNVHEKERNDSPMNAQGNSESKSNGSIQEDSVKKKGEREKEREGNDVVVTSENKQEDPDDDLSSSGDEPEDDDIDDLPQDADHHRENSSYVLDSEDENGLNGQHQPKSEKTIVKTNLLDSVAESSNSEPSATTRSSQVPKSSQKNKPISPKSQEKSTSKERPSVAINPVFGREKMSTSKVTDTKKGIASPVSPKTQQTKAARNTGRFGDKGAKKEVKGQSEKKGGKSGRKDNGDSEKVKEKEKEKEKDVENHEEEANDLVVELRKSQVRGDATDDEMLASLSDQAANRKFRPSTVLKNPEEKYEIIQELGEGTYGVVYMAHDKHTNQLVAIKVVPVEDDEELEDLKREIDFLKQVKDCDFIVRYHGSFQKEEEIWIVMDLCDSGSVGDILTICDRALKVEEMAEICAATIVGLSYLHRKNLIHRDIKAGNILLTTDGRAKLADFGVSAKLDTLDPRRNSLIGTPYWMAPEVIKEDFYDGKADIWSLGITLIEMADKNPPLENEHPMRALLKIPKMKEPPTFSDPNAWPKVMTDFLSLCLVINPSERANAEDLRDHPFVKDHIDALEQSGYDHGSEVLKALVAECGPTIRDFYKSGRHKDPDEEIAAKTAKKTRRVKAVKTKGRKTLKKAKQEQEEQEEQEAEEEEEEEYEDDAENPEYDEELEEYELQYDEFGNPYSEDMPLDPSQGYYESPEGYYDPSQQQQYFTHGHHAPDQPPQFFQGPHHQHRHHHPHQQQQLPFQPRHSGLAGNPHQTQYYSQDPQSPYSHPSHRQQPMRSDGFNHGYQHQQFAQQGPSGSGFSGMQGGYSRVANSEPERVYHQFGDGTGGFISKPRAPRAYVPGQYQPVDQSFQTGMRSPPPHGSPRHPRSSSGMKRSSGLSGKGNGKGQAKSKGKGRESRVKKHDPDFEAMSGSGTFQTFDVTPEQEVDTDQSTFMSYFMPGSKKRSSGRVIRFFGRRKPKPTRKE